MYVVVAVPSDDFEELMHKVRRARALRAYPDGRSAQIGRGRKGVVLSAREQQGFGLGKPAKELMSPIGGHRSTVLDEGKFLGATRSCAGQAFDDLD